MMIKVSKSKLQPWHLVLNKFAIKETVAINKIRFSAFVIVV